MAMIDYGYILLRDGKLIDCTDNHMFMEVSDVGIPPVEDAYDYYNKSYGISGNYFAYVGDENLMLCFYKTHIKLIRGDRVLGTIYCGHYNEKYPDDRNVYYSTMSVETLHNPFNCGIDIKIDLLDRNYYLMDCGTTRDDGFTSWEYYKKCIGWENERTSAYTEREHKKFLKNMRARKVLEKIYRGRDLWELPDVYVTNDQSHKFDVTFTLNGFEYEVIFGYGIKGFKEQYPINYTAQEVWSLMCADPNVNTPKYPNWW